MLYTKLNYGRQKSNIVGQFLRNQFIYRMTERRFSYIPVYRVGALIPDADACTGTFSDCSTFTELNLCLYCNYAERLLVTVSAENA